MPLLFALGLPGFPELILILVIVLVLFGSKRLPELARGLGSSMKEFRKARDEFEQEFHRGADAEAPKAAAIEGTPSAANPAVEKQP